MSGKTSLQCAHLQHPAVTKGRHAHNNLLLGNTVSEVVAYGVVQVESSKVYDVFKCPLCPLLTCVRGGWGHPPRVSHTGECCDQ